MKIIQRTELNFFFGLTIPSHVFFMIMMRGSLSEEREEIGFESMNFLSILKRHRQQRQQQQPWPP
jgi:hypothetical protein